MHLTRRNLLFGLGAAAAATAAAPVLVTSETLLGSAAAKAAIQGANGKELAGRALTVNEAKPREPRREPRQARW